MVLTFTMEITTVCYSTYEYQLMKCLHWIAYSLAYCHILWFALILSTVVCVIIFVPYMIHKGFNGCDRRMCLPILCVFIIGVTTCGLVFIFTLLFNALVDNGLQLAGTGGFILSLIPPSHIFVVGLLVECQWAMYHTSITNSLMVQTHKLRQTICPCMTVKAYKGISDEQVMYQQS